MNYPYRMKAICYTYRLVLLLLWSAALPNGGAAQSGPVADYVANYYEMLNNLGDASMPLSDRRLFRSELLSQYFLFDGSLIWNDLRPQGSQYIRPQEYLDNILTDFPRGAAFAYSDLQIGPLLPEGGSLKTVVTFRSEISPVGQARISNDLQMVLTIQEFSANAISARIKSIDKAGAGASTSVQPEPERQDAAPTAAEQESRAWQQALSADRVSGYEGYLSAYPSGLHVAEARRRIGELRDEAAWSEAKRQDSEDAFASYLQDYSDGRHASEARNRLEALRKSELPTPIQELERNMVRVEGGRFKMGCTAEQGSDCWSREKPAHRVELSSFSIGKYEVTQAQWEAVMGSNPSGFSSCGSCPVENVSWNDVQDFIVKLNRMTGGNYRLPTEAEWEYAARGGNRSRGHKYSGSDNLGSVGWYRDNSDKKTHPVGKKTPNELGLYDMSGNVWEWCSDWYDKDYYSSSPARNPKGPGGG
ncbi:formylglycine-generating enzyme family protein, partial [Phaeodactylibacter xiamenensis]|uniref:formylglycine-generating enzyme family protein n=1 Tax=Phaeodactylibacter xiamenensis TaxID=1524460 RepID=UPI0024A892AF